MGLGLEFFCARDVDEKVFCALPAPLYPAQGRVYLLFLDGIGTSGASLQMGWDKHWDIRDATGGAFLQGDGNGCALGPCHALRMGFTVY